MKAMPEGNSDSHRWLLQTQDATFFQDLRTCLDHYAKHTTIYFGPSDEGPDHIGKIDRGIDGVRYEIQGHGIAKTVFHPKNEDELLNLILEHNRILNLHDQILIVSSEST
jgi:hypothetical protein